MGSSASGSPEGLEEIGGDPPPTRPSSHDFSWCLSCSFLLSLPLLGPLKSCPFLPSARALASCCSCNEVSQVSRRQPMRVCSFGVPEARSRGWVPSGQRPVSLGPCAFWEPREELCPAVSSLRARPCSWLGAPPPPLKPAVQCPAASRLCASQHVSPLTLTRLPLSPKGPPR